MSNFINSDQINFDKQDGLIPVIVQDHANKEVLMCAFMNRTAWELTQKTGQAHYWSRSRQSIWKKGEQSGNRQQVVRAHLDCDGDTILLEVVQQGAACHTGRRSCFYRMLYQQSEDVVNRL